MTALYIILFFAGSPAFSARRKSSECSFCCIFFILLWKEAFPYRGQAVPVGNRWGSAGTSEHPEATPSEVFHRHGAAKRHPRCGKGSAGFRRSRYGAARRMPRAFRVGASQASARKCKDSTGRVRLRRALPSGNARSERRADAADLPTPPLKATASAFASVPGSARSLSERKRARTPARAFPHRKALRTAPVENRKRGRFGMLGGPSAPRGLPRGLFRHGKACVSSGIALPLPRIRKTSLSKGFRAGGEGGGRFPALFRSSYHSIICNSTRLFPQLSVSRGLSAFSD